jgi:glycosyltransferase involved in cell wall biosynthesis
VLWSVLKIISKENMDFGIIKSVAAIAAQYLAKFEKNRRYFDEPDLINFLENFLCKSPAYFSALSENEKLAAIESLFNIYSTLAFIRWKKLTSFYKDSFYICENYIDPLNKILGCRDLSGSNGSGVIAYLPNLNPLGLNSASSLGSRGIVESYTSSVAESSLGIRKFLVFIHNPSIATGHVEVEGASLGLKTLASVIFFREFRDLVNVLKSNNVEAVLYDYFTMPWVFLPLMLSKVRFVYLSFGFNLAVFNHTKAILAYGKRDEIYESYIRKNYQTHQSKLRWIPGRIESTFPNLDPAREISSSALARIEAVRKNNDFVFVSLCRGTKISQLFLEFLRRLIECNVSVGVVIAGPGVDRIEAPWKIEENKNRVAFLDQTPPFHVLNVANFYIETWPEHQGHAVIEAMHFKVPVLSINGNECDHTLLAERSPNSVYPDSASLLDAIPNFLANPNKTNTILDDQAKILREVYCDPKYFWQIFIDSIRS